VPSSSARVVAHASPGRANAADAKTARKLLIPRRSIGVLLVRPFNGK
jgi:hypothetical protein